MRKRDLKKGRLSAPKPIVVKISPTELRQGLTLPKVTYQVVGMVEFEEVYSGMILPFPKVLIYFLRPQELKVLSVILEESISNEGCYLTLQEIADRLKISLQTVSNSLYAMRKMGLLMEIPCKAIRPKGRVRRLNYKCIQHLNDLAENEDPGVYARIRKTTRKIDIMKITKDDIRGCYDNIILPPDHDPAEEEEYR